MSPSARGFTSRWHGPNPGDLHGGSFSTVGRGWRWPPPPSMRSATSPGCFTRAQRVELDSQGRIRFHRTWPSWPGWGAKRSLSVCETTLSFGIGGVGRVTWPSGKAASTKLPRPHLAVRWKPKATIGHPEENKRVVRLKMFASRENRRDASPGHRLAFPPCLIGRTPFSRAGGMDASRLRTGNPSSSSLTS